MWTPANRQHYEVKGKQKKRYPTAESDAEWAWMAPLMPGTVHTGRPREVDLREVINALRYLVRTRCDWPYISARVRWAGLQL